ncbi:MAG: MFS transporter [Thermomicrobiales bacterium]
MGLVRAHDDLLAAGAVLGAVVARHIEQRIGRSSMMALGYLGPFFLAIAVFQPGMPVIYAAWFVFGFLDALAVISFQAYLAEAVPASERGRMYAAWGAVVSLAAAIAFYGMGWITRGSARRRPLRWPESRWESARR